MREHDYDIAGGMNEERNHPSWQTARHMMMMMMMMTMMMMMMMTMTILTLMIIKHYKNHPSHNIKVLLTLFLDFPASPRRGEGAFRALQIQIFTAEF